MDKLSTSSSVLKNMSQPKYLYKIKQIKNYSLHACGKMQ